MPCSPVLPGSGPSAGGGGRRLDAAHRKTAMSGWLLLVITAVTGST